MKPYFLTTLLAATPLLAEQDFQPVLMNLPALYQVTGLTEGDHLNMRQGPGVTFDDIGDLQMGQKVEVIRFGPDGRWAQIGAAETSAWVYRKFLTPAHMARLPNTELPATLTCTGTEPFWSWRVANGKIAFDALSEDKFPTEEIAWEEKTPEDPFSFIIASASWRGILEKKLCSDGMSDGDYGLKAVIMGTTQAHPRLLSGCCSIPVE